MIKMPYDQIISKITSDSKLSSTEIEAKIKSKLNQLSGMISKEGAAHIVANELNVKLFGASEGGKVQIKDILPGMRNVELLAKVLSVYEVRSFQKGERSGKVGSFRVGDETGAIRIVCWGSQTDKMKNLKEGDIIRIKSGYVRENNSFKEIHLNDMAVMVINPPGETVDVKEPSFSRKTIAELGDNDSQVELLGHIVQIFDPKFYEVCPECGKRTRPDGEVFKCPIHGEIDPSYNYLLNFQIDDGSETIRTVIFRNLVEQFLNKSNEDILRYRMNPEQFMDVRNALLGNLLKMRGRVSKNEMFERKEFVCQWMDTKPSSEEELKRLEETIK